MKAEDLKGKTRDELHKMLMDTRKDQFNARLQRAAGQLENTASLRATRRAIARIKTFISQQVNGTANAAAKPAAKKKAAKA